MLLAPYVCFHIFSLVKVTEWPPIEKIDAHSAYEMFSWYKCVIVSLVFSHLGFWSGNLFLIAPFPDLCLLVHLILILCPSLSCSPSRALFLIYPPPPLPSEMRSLNVFEKLAYGCWINSCLMTD